jgi:hypothetical protein
MDRNDYTKKIGQYTFYEVIGGLSAIVGAFSIGIGLREYVEQNRGFTLKDGLSLALLVGGSITSYYCHSKRMYLAEQKSKIESIPYLYIPSTIDQRE